ncbi:iron-containing alcohol dehydrogenase [Candidatus Aerophobetes bacterium]|nr:iron-containing alcohol dehydrogenase [Candidatus Aerophobetes bacterium]
MLNETVWSFCIPATIKFGEGAVEEIGYEVRKLNGSKALIVTDAGIVEAGICNKVETILRDSGVEVDAWTKVEPEPSIDVFAGCCQYARQKGFDSVIGLGGGSSIDVAKVASMLTKYGGDILDYIAPPTGKGKKYPAPGITMIAIPTTSGTGSEVSPAAVISLPEQKLKVGISDNFQRPDVAIVDPLLTLGLPPNVTAASGMDALAHAIEAYTTRRYDQKIKPATPAERAIYNGTNNLTDICAMESIGLVSRYLRRAVNNGYDIEARRGMSLASLLAGIAFTNAGLTAVHAMTFPVGGEFHTAHGITVALLLPYVMQFNAKGDASRFADIARIMGEAIQGLSLKEAARKAVFAVSELALDIGIPLSLKGFGCKESDAPHLAEGAMKIQRLLVGNPRRIDLKDLEDIFLKAIKGEI